MFFRHVLLRLLSSRLSFGFCGHRTMAAHVDGNVNKVPVLKMVRQWRCPFHLLRVTVLSLREHLDVIVDGNALNPVLDVWRQVIPTVGRFDEPWKEVMPQVLDIVAADANVEMVASIHA